jgi:hypothetical protein
MTRIEICKKILKISRFKNFRYVFCAILLSRLNLRKQAACYELADRELSIEKLYVVFYRIFRVLFCGGLSNTA